MRYQVQYWLRNERQTAEVEASSPQEAIVKFCHTRADRSPAGRQPQQVLSVCEQEDPDNLAW